MYDTWLLRVRVNQLVEGFDESELLVLGLEVII